MHCDYRKRRRHPRGDDTRHPRGEEVETPERRKLLNKAHARCCASTKASEGFQTASSTNQHVMLQSEPKKRSCFKAIPKSDHASRRSYKSDHASKRTPYTPIDCCKSCSVTGTHVCAVTTTR
jgi:hypothetical protein